MPPHIVSMMYRFSRLPQVRWESMPEARVTSEKEMEEDVGRRAAEPALRALLDCGRDAAAAMYAAAPTRKALAPRAKKSLDCRSTGAGRWTSRQLLAEP